MGFWLFVAGVVLLYIVTPYIRCFFKRLKCGIKINRVCREKGYIIHKNHALWFLGGKKGKRCDCYVETDKEVLAIKFFNIPRKRRVLVFREDGMYFVRRFMGMEIRIIYSFDGRVKEFPKYDFEYRKMDGADDKCIRKILLVNPVPMEMRMQARNGKESIVSPGDRVYGLEVCNISRFLNELGE